MGDYVVGDNPIPKLIFRKTPLRPSHITGQLNVPDKVLQEYPVFGQPRDFTSFDRRGNAWRFRLSVRRGGQYYKPYFTKKVWHPFVEAKRLRQDDEVHFYRLRNKSKDVILVRAYRRDPGTGNWLDVDEFPLPEGGAAPAAE